MHLEVQPIASEMVLLDSRKHAPFREKNVYNLMVHTKYKNEYPEESRKRGKFYLRIGICKSIF